MRLDPDTSRRLFAGRPVARLATTGDRGPHIVPIVFAIDGDTIVSVIDHKPKATTRLQRLRNIERSPRVALLVDHYEDDWMRLWWVRADAHGTVSHRAEDLAAATSLLAERYSQYRETAPDGPAVVFEVMAWSGWAATVPPVAR